MQCKSLGFVAILISLGLQAPVRADDLLGSAQGFAVLAGSTVTNTGSATIITGDVGVWPGSAITGFPPGTVVGTIRANDTVAQQAQSDLTVAYNTLAGMALTDTMTDIDLGGLTLGPGVYRFATAAVMSSSGLTLDGEGDPNALFVFQVGTTLITASSASVTMINEAQACNVYWQVGSSATLGIGTTFRGSIVALASVTLTTGVTIAEGRALARNGAVTLDASPVSLATCASEAAVPRVPHASAEVGGRTTITYVDSTGHPTMLQRSPLGGMDHAIA